MDIQAGQEQPCNHFMVWNIQGGYSYYRCDKCRYIDGEKTFADNLQPHNAVNGEVKNNNDAIDEVLKIVEAMRYGDAMEHLQINDHGMSKAHNIQVKQAITKIKALKTNAVDKTVENRTVTKEKKSVEELKPLMGEAYKDLSVQVAFKEGYNKAIETSLQKKEDCFDNLLSVIKEYNNGWVKQEIENDEVIVKKVAPEYVVIDDLIKFLEQYKSGKDGER